MNLQNGIAVSFLILVAACSRMQAAPPSGADTTTAQADCTELLQAHSAKSVEACKAQLDQAEKSPPDERLARMVANDEYGIALLGFAHEPEKALDAFNREIAMLPGSTVKPDTLQWAVAYWHRATALQQLGRDDQAEQDLSTAENSFEMAAKAASANPQQAGHFNELRKRVLAQHAAILERQGKGAEARHLLTTQ